MNNLIPPMNSKPDDTTPSANKHFDAALQSLQNRPPGVDLSHFEHEVWSEIAMRDEDATADRTGWFSAGFALPNTALAACCVFAIAIGSLFGITRSQAYDKAAKMADERRYVESIHPVMMSANHSAPARR